jgi:hypothetical protein
MTSIHLTLACYRVSAKSICRSWDTCDPSFYCSFLVFFFGKEPLLRAKTKTVDRHAASNVKKNTTVES